MSSKAPFRLDKRSSGKRARKTVLPTTGLPVSEAKSPKQAINGHQLKTMFSAGYAWLENHKETVNALNVFPVPDGDTGTNMFLTMRAAFREIDHSDDSDAGHIAQAIAQGALMGARGNSGVILSQILRGIAHAFRQKALVSAYDLAQGLRQGAETAYKGVVKPVEGTILTVIRQAADAALRAADVDDSLEFVLGHTVQAAGEAVEQTPRLLPVLAKAGVVDSGGKGLYYILEGMYRSLRGESTALSADKAASPAPAADAVALDPHNLPPIRYGFDVQFLVWGNNLDVAAIRQWMIDHGDFALVEGSKTLVKVHVHVFDPSKPLAYGVQQGFLTDVVVENMDAMAAAGMIPEDVKDELSTAPTAPEPAEQAEQVEPLGVVAVSPGPGLSEVFASLGAGRIIAGGQTMNPSIQEILEAIRALPAEQVLVLPNNGNVVMAAQAAAAEAARTGKPTQVIPSRTAPQGISALLAFNPQADVQQNVAAMNRALGQIRTGEVTYAVRAAEMDGVAVQAGDVIGLLDDVLTTRSDTPQQVVFNLLQQMNAATAEIITVYFGEQTSEAAADELGAALRAAYPDQEVEVVPGGQPHYHYIVSAE